MSKKLLTYLLVAAVFFTGIDFTALAAEVDEAVAVENEAEAMEVEETEAEATEAGVAENKDDAIGGGEQGVGGSEQGDAEESSEGDASLIQGDESDASEENAVEVPVPEDSHDSEESQTQDKPDMQETGEQDELIVDESVTDGSVADESIVDESVTGEIDVELVELDADGNIASGVIDENYGHITWVIDAGGKLTVTGEGDYNRANFSDAKAPWDSWSKDIVTAVITLPGMTNAARMFENCSNLTNVKFEASSAYEVIDMRSMFAGCSSLTDLDVSMFNTSKVLYMNDMFANCSSLAALDISNFDTSAVKNMNRMFYGCSSLTELDLSRFDTKNVTDMACMFSGCTNLESLDLSNFWINGGNGEAVNEMFKNCDSLNTLYSPPYISYQPIIELPRTFYDEADLEYTYISYLMPITSRALTTYRQSGAYKVRFDGNGSPGSSKLDMVFEVGAEHALRANHFMRYGYTFAGWNTNADGSGVPYDDKEIVSGLSTEGGVTVTLYAMWEIEDQELLIQTTGTLGTNGNITWTYDKDAKTLTVTGEDELYGTKEQINSNNIATSPLKQVCIGKDIEKLIFTDCKLTGSAACLLGNLTEVGGLDLSGLDTSGVTDMSWMFADNDRLTVVDISMLKTGNVNDMAGMFYNCSSLGNLDLRSFDTSKVTDMRSMFSGCSGLDSLDVSSFQTANVTDMRSMFSGCSSLESLNLSNFDTSKVKNIGHMFNDCSSLRSLDVSHFDTSKVTVITRVFYGCSSLHSLDVSHFDMSKVTSMSSMFAGCSSLYSLDVSLFDTSKVTSMFRMFYGCSSLYSLDVSHFDTSKVTSMSGMFSGCSSLDSLDLSGFDTSRVTDMTYMFSECSRLRSLDVGHFDTSKVTNMEYIFWKCSELGRLDLSNFDMRNVTSVTIAASMISGCGNLHTLYTPKAMGAVTVTLPTTFYDANGTGYATLSDANLSRVLTTFQQADAFQIQFDGNGAEQGSMRNQYIEIGEGQELCANAYKKPGYAFAGWNTDANGNGAKYDDEEYVMDLVGAKGTIIIYAQWTPAEYTICLDDNGGKEGYLEEDVIDCIGGEEYTLPKCTYERTGYIFVGWNTRANGNGTSFDDQAKVKNLTSEDGSIVTLYAQWKVIEYKITYELYGGKNAAANPKLYYVYTDTVTLSEPTQKYYNFEGWYSDAAFTNKVTKIEKGSTGDKTLYAKWKAYTYTIRFDRNGATGGSMNDLSCSYGEKYILPENTFKKEGYTFTGWRTKADGSGTAYKDKEEIQNLSKKDGVTLTLYAKWSVIQYNVTYELNGGSNKAANPKTYTVNNTIKLAEPTKKYHVFEGWYSDASFTNKVTEIAKGSTGDKIFYAKWRLYIYKLKFDGHGATEGKINDMTCIYGEKYTLPENPYKRNGYTFVGWKVQGVIYNEKSEIQNLATVDGATVNVSAIWSPIEYHITYELNGGTNSTSNPTSYNADMNYIGLVKPTKDHHAFEGWYSDAAFANRVAGINHGSTGDKTFYAQWRIYKYAIWFCANWELAGDMKVLNCDYGETYTLPENIYQRDGYTFAGWNTKEDGSGKAYGDKAEVTNLSVEDCVSVILYAQWVKNDDVGTGTDDSGTVNKHGQYKITYSLSGGKNSTKNPASYDKDWNTITLVAPTREGYDFAGWYSDAALTKVVTQINSGSIGNIFLFAKWTAHKYSISFHGNGADSGNMPDQQCSYGTLKELSANKYWKNGCGFIGWNTKADGTGTSYRNRDGVLDLTERDGGSVTLYAQWKPDVYAITYVTGGGSNKGNPGWYESGTGGITLQAPAREGYTFKGWYADSKYKKKSAAIPAGSAEDKTFYAKWAANKYTVRFDGNDSTSGKMAAMKNRVYAKKFKLSANKFKKKGYTFLGWNTEADGTGIPYKNKASVSSLTSDAKGEVTLYAMWQETRYKITYKLNKGMGNPANPSAYTVSSDTITLADPVRDGYTFVGWYSDAKFKKRVTQISQGSTGNKTLYAKWKKKE